MENGPGRIHGTRVGGDVPPLFRGGGNGDDGGPQVGGQRIPGGEHGLQIGVRRCGWLQAGDGLLQRRMRRV